MKRLIIILGLVVFLAVSCEKREQQESKVSNVSFTPCLQNNLRSSELSDKVDVKFNNKDVLITYRNFEATCDFTTVNVTYTFVNGVLRITQKGTPNLADCICHTDVSYTIEGISQNDVNVIFINGVQVYCYNENNTLKGTKWKLVGIVDVQTDVLTELEPKDCEKCYTLTFDTDNPFVSSATNEGIKSWGENYFVTFSASNELGGNYIADYASHSFQIIGFGGTKAGEMADGYFYADPLWKREIKSFFLQGNELRLYYNENKNYLLFKTWNP